MCLALGVEDATVDDINSALPIMTMRNIQDFLEFRGPYGNAGFISSTA